MKHILHVTNNDEYYTKKWTLSYVIIKDCASPIIDIDGFERM